MRRRFKLKAFITLVAVFALGIVLPLILHASTDDNARSVKVAYTQQEFIETLAPTAQKMSKNYGVPASILLSQAAYESNYGSSLLSVKYHNIYSLPAQPGQERIRLKDSIYSKGKWQYQKVDFAVFKDWSSSMMTYLEEHAKEHGANRPIKRWQKRLVIKLRQKNYKLRVLAVIRLYKHLISIIETYHLSKYD
ncbi:MAG: glucosaminidase domain-containing protein [Streptococcus sp.]